MLLAGNLVFSRNQDGEYQMEIRSRTTLPFHTVGRGRQCEFFQPFSFICSYLVMSSSASSVLLSFSF